LLVFTTSVNAASADDGATAYLGQVETRIMAAWRLPPKSNELKVTLRYTLAANGSVSSARVEESSGNRTFDESAVQAVRRASPFPPLPKSFPTGDLGMVLDPSLPIAPPKRTLRQQQAA
jgi:TonB family protein